MTYIYIYSILHRPSLSLINVANHLSVSSAFLGKIRVENAAQIFQLVSLQLSYGMFFLSFTVHANILQTPTTTEVPSETENKIHNTKD